MIRILTYDRRDSAPLAFDTMFEDRKALFVDLLRWDVPVVDGRFEMDAFDAEGAIYLIALDDEGEHQGSLRLLPTDRPHLLDSMFGQLCPLGIPAGPGVLEITRLCLPSRLGARSRLEVRNALISAMVDYALVSGVTRLTGLVEVGFRKEVLSMGWLAEPIGPATLFGGATLGAFALHITSDTPVRLGWTGIYRPDALALRFASAPCGSSAMGVATVHEGGRLQ
ncbi:MAG: acyl-homoserine-lactone synthase [Pseudomonadota bacterium]